MEVLAGADFFTVEVLTWRGLVTYYVLFFIDVGSRRVSVGGITLHPDSCWMEQVARNATMQDTGYLNGCRYTAARSRYEVLPRFPGNTCSRRCEVHANPSEKSEFECPRGTLGPFHQRGMLIEADPFWRELVTACRVRFRGALSPRKKPSGQR
jgi:hypothetical protein